jgi:hypothetical protein
MTKRDGGTYYWSTCGRLFASLLALPMRSVGKSNAVIFWYAQQRLSQWTSQYSCETTTKFATTFNSNELYVFRRAFHFLHRYAIRSPHCHPLHQQTLFNLHDNTHPDAFPNFNWNTRAHGSSLSGIWKCEFFLHSMDHWHSSRYHSCGIYPYPVVHRHNAESPRP